MPASAPRIGKIDSGTGEKRNSPASSTSAKWGFLPGELHTSQ
jgi:hypothetical protein